MSTVAILHTSVINGTRLIAQYKYHINLQIIKKEKYAGIKQLINLIFKRTRVITT